VVEERSLSPSRVRYSSFIYMNILGNAYRFPRDRAAIYPEEPGNEPWNGDRATTHREPQTVTRQAQRRTREQSWAG